MENEITRDEAMQIWQEHATLLLGDHRGVFIPRDFLEFEKFIPFLNADQIADLKNPESETYWDTWHEVLDKQYNIDGVTYALIQDGDLFAYPVDKVNSDVISFVFNY